MPPERKGRIPPDPQPQPEPWYRAARYAAEPLSEQAYFKAQETIYQEECDISAYRLMLEQIYHVAVLGGTPAEAGLQQRLETILYQDGTPTQLPDEVLTVLFERKNSPPISVHGWKGITDLEKRCMSRKKARNPNANINHSF